jgi:hypothetical protein
VTNEKDARVLRYENTVNVGLVRNFLSRMELMNFLDWLLGILQGYLDASILSGYDLTNQNKKK